MVKFKVKGMMDTESARQVTRAVNGLPEVDRTVADWRRGEVMVVGAVDERPVRQAIEGAGFKVDAPIPPPVH